MVRGRRTRAAALISTTSRSLDDQFCASPKRKDCKLELNNKDEKKKVLKNNSRAITNYFHVKQKQIATTENLRQYVNDLDENARHAFPIADENDEEDDDDEVAVDDDDDETNDDDVEIIESNIFLQAPVLHLNIDKSPNQPSSIVINKQIEVKTNFSALTAGIAFPKLKELNVPLAKPSQKLETKNTRSKTSAKLIQMVPETSDTSSSSSSTSSSSTSSDPSVINNNSDSNSSYDSGVVADKTVEFACISPSKRRKPTTPHRIVCPSPVKQKSPSSQLSNLNIGTKKNPKTKRRLNVNESENLNAITSRLNAAAKRSNQPGRNSPATTNTTITIDNLLADAATVQDATAAATTTIDKKVLNAAKDPTAQQNTTNNFKLPTQTTATKLTDFFPVRRSVRKTKKCVEQEQLRSIEAAIRNETEDGLIVKEFENKGRGICAARSFVKGEFVVEYIGDLINMTEANNREQLYAKDENTGCYMYYFKYKNQQYCIDATAETGKLGRLVNHSRNGNLITKTVFYRNQPHLVLIAKEDIMQGEELNYDYGDRSKEALLHHPWLAL